MKKLPEKPSGPGELSFLRENTALLISSASGVPVNQRGNQRGLSKVLAIEEK